MKISIAPFTPRLHRTSDGFMTSPASAASSLSSLSRRLRMSRIENRKIIKADPQAVFDFLAERTNAPKIVPHLEKVWEIKPPAAGVGQTWRWQFRLFGMPFEGTAEMIEFSPGHRLQFTTRGKLRSTWTYA